MPKAPPKAKTWQDALFSRPKAKGRAKPDVAAVLREDPYCPYCGDRMVFYDLKKRPTRDHSLPKSRGHTLSDGNKIVCCLECNNAKANRSLLQWLKSLRRSDAKKDVIRATRINHLIEIQQLRGIKIDDGEVLDA